MLLGQGLMSHSMEGGIEGRSGYQCPVDGRREICSIHRKIHLPSEISCGINAGARERPVSETEFCRAGIVTMIDGIGMQ
jgi:hypothetical protein